MVAGVQVGPADAAAQHVEHQLALGGDGIRQVDDLEGVVHTADRFHPAIVAR